MGCGIKESEVRESLLKACELLTESAVAMCRMMPDKDGDLDKASAESMGLIDKIRDQTPVQICYELGRALESYQGMMPLVMLVAASCKRGE